MRTILILTRSCHSRRFLLASLLLIAACAGDHRGRPEAIEVVTTTDILGDIVRHLAGPDATVDVLVPSGADPHEYQLSSGQVAELQGADLVVANGLGLEEGLQDVLDAAMEDGVEVVAVGDRIDPLDGDPHFWMDPLRVAEAARLVATELTELAPGADWKQRAETYAAELEDLDRRITEILDPIPATQRKLVTNHEALTYFAERYGFVIVGVVVPGGSTLGEPSSGQVADLVRTIEEEQVAVIFAETTEPTRLAETVAAEVGHDMAVVELHTESLGEPGSGADTLLGMLETDAELIAAALGG